MSFETAYREALDLAGTPYALYVPEDDIGPAKFNTTEQMERFADLHAELVTDRYYENSPLHVASGFVQTRRRRHDSALRPLVVGALSPAYNLIAHRLEQSLGDGQPVVFVQPRFSSIDLEKRVPTITVHNLAKFRTQRIVSPSCADRMPSFVERGTNGAAEASRTPEEAEDMREARIDELLTIKQVGPSLSFVGYRPILVADMMHKALEVALGDYFDSREERLQLVADWLVGQTVWGHGISGPASLFYASRISNADIKPGLWMFLDNQTVRMSCEDYYSQIARTVKLVGDAVAIKTFDKGLYMILNAISKRRSRTGGFTSETDAV